MVKKANIVYSEPADYFREERLKKFKLGKYALEENDEKENDLSDKIFNHAEGREDK